MSRTMPTECDRCGGIVDWGDFGPDPDDNLAGTTCSCPTGQMRDDLALALRLLDAHTWPPHEVPCRFDHHGGCQEHGFLSLEPGEKCPNQEAHELLVRHGIREGTA